MRVHFEQGEYKIDLGEWNFVEHIKDICFPASVPEI